MVRVSLNRSVDTIRYSFDTCQMRKMKTGGAYVGYFRTGSISQPPYQFCASGTESKADSSEIGKDEKWRAEADSVSLGFGVCFRFFS